MKGFSKILEGIVKYTMNEKKQTLFKLKTISANPEPLSVMFSCMDSRVILSKFTSCDPGDNYMVKNAGNFVPHPESIGTSPSAAGAALDLTCVRNPIRHVVVTGHSDCKAMQMLYHLRNNLDVRTGSPLELWIRKHGKASIDKFNQLQKNNHYKGPLSFFESTPVDSIALEIDPENNYGMVDKLSQVNCVQQLEHVAAYPMLKERLENRDVLLHALWYDIYSGKVYIMSRQQKRFEEITEQSYFNLMDEVRNSQI